MNLDWANVKRLGPLFLASVAGACAGAFLRSNFFEAVTQELIALFGLVMAAVLPAMTLTATALRSGNLSPLRVNILYTALRQQLKVWFGMFAIALFLCAIVVVGKTMAWTYIVHIPFVAESGFETCRLLVGLIVFGSVLFLARVGAVGRGILSILDLSREVAMSEAKALEEERARRLARAVEQIVEPTERGSYVDLPH